MRNRCRQLSANSCRLRGGMIGAEHGLHRLVLDRPRTPRAARSRHADAHEWRLAGTGDAGPTRSSPRGCGGAYPCRPRRLAVTARSIRPSAHVGELAAVIDCIAGVRHSRFGAGTDTRRRRRAGSRSGASTPIEACQLASVRAPSGPRRCLRRSCSRRRRRAFRQLVAAAPVGAISRRSTSSCWAVSACRVIGRGDAVLLQRGHVVLDQVDRFGARWRPSRRESGRAGPCVGSVHGFDALDQLAVDQADATGAIQRHESLRVAVEIVEQSRPIGRHLEIAAGRRGPSHRAG